MKGPTCHVFWLTCSPKKQPTKSSSWMAAARTIRCVRRASTTSGWLARRPAGVYSFAAAPRRRRGISCFFFLHADCRFPRGGLSRIKETLSASPRVVGGNFRLVFDGNDGFSRWLTDFCAWFRGRGLYYGDSGVFVRRQVYDAIGGVRPIALMEDFDFTRRLERFGPTRCIEHPPLITSSRRFEGRHPLRIVSGWLKVHALYYLSVPPARLARIYDGEQASEISTAAARAGRMS